MKKIDALVIAILFVFWLFIFPVILRQLYGSPSPIADPGGLGGAVLLAIVGSIGFYSILANYIRSIKKST